MENRAMNACSPVGSTFTFAASCSLVKALYPWMAMLTVPKRANKESISNASMKLIAVPNIFLFFRAAMAMIRKIRPRKAKNIVMTIGGFGSNTILLF